MEQPEPPSKSQRKRDMDALQRIGTELVALNAQQLSQIDLPERLLDAVVEAQRISSFEGKRRQLQYIGRLMRDVDPQPIRDKLAQWQGAAGAHTALHQRTERWRERLLSSEEALGAFAAEFSGADLQHVRTLVASVRRDQATGKTPRKYRELFRVLHALVTGKGTA